MWRMVFLVGFALVRDLGPTATPAQEKVQVKVVKYTEMGQLVRQNLGKVIVLDLWATW